MTSNLRDRAGRPLRNLRVSVTDRCNLRCSYCMPEEDYTWLPKARLLHYGQLAVLVEAAVQLGVRKVRLTGGEPLLRRELWRFIEQLRALDGLDEIALTTNALLLEEQAAALFAAGLDRITVSLDTLRPDRFQQHTRRDGLAATLAGIEAAVRHGGQPVKLNAVVHRGFNDDEIPDLLDFARTGGHELRFIEYMDVDGATRWRSEDVVPQDEILERAAAHLGPLEPVPRHDAAPADRYQAPDGTMLGVIASTTQPFCGTCDRARLTADGQLFTCLYARVGTPLAHHVRAGETANALADRLAARWSARDDRGAEERLELASDRAPRQAADLRGDPHAEMHTKGG